MKLREQQPTGNKYGNILGETGFSGSRVEGKNRVGTRTFTVPYQSPEGITKYASVTFKSTVPNDALVADYTDAVTKSFSYLLANVTTVNLIEIASGAIEQTIADIA